MPMTSGCDKNPNQFAIWAVLLLASLSYLCISVFDYAKINGEVYFTLSDDPMISMRYARNFSQGYGLRWNIGEPPVEGYSNFLWTAIMAVFHLLPIAESKVSLPIKLLCGLLLLINSLFCVRLVRKITDNPLASLGCVILTSFFWPLSHWSVMSGFEVGAIACLTSASLVCSLTDSKQFLGFSVLLGFLCSCLVLLRPDGVVFALAPLAVVAYRVYLRELNWFHVGIALSILSFTFVMMTYWRWMYYGEFFPNTYFLKAVGVSFWQRFPRGVNAIKQSAANLLTGSLVFSILGTIVAIKKNQRSLAVGVWSLMLLVVSYLLYLGGDTWEAPERTDRFLTQAVSPLFVLATLGIAQTVDFFSVESKKKRFLMTALFILLTLGFHSISGTYSHLAYLWRLNPSEKRGGIYQRVHQGVWLKKNAKPEDTISVIWAGALPYFSHLKSFDALGKSDPVIARINPKNPNAVGHNKYNHQYTFLVQKPNFIEMLWDTSPEDQALLKKLGYRKNSVGLFEKN